MFYRSSIVFMAAVALLAACRFTSVEEPLPTVTAMLAVHVTELSATETPTAIPVTETYEAPTEPVEAGFKALEIIQVENWTGLGLLKTFPAEMPLQNSAVAISPDGKTMAVGSSSQAQIFFFDLPVGQLSQVVPVNGVANADASFRKLEYLPDGTIMANSDGPYMIYRIDTGGNVLAKWESSSFALSADKRIMAYGSGAGVTLVDIPSNTALGSFEADYAVDYSFSPDGSRIAVNVVGVDYADTVIWDIVDQKQLAKLVETGNPRFSPDGRFLAVSSYQEGKNPMKIFSPDGATEIKILDGTVALWSPDGSILVTQIGNGPVAAWDTTSWQPLDTSALQGELYSYTLDGRLLITRTDDGSILLSGIVP